MVKRVFDILSSLIVLTILFPFLLIIAILISLESKGGPFFSQVRVGKDNKEFKLYKFRSMRVDSEKQGQLTVGGRDPRVTRMGRFIRKTKIDEFPQLLNVIVGDMSVVGPRPEVRKYVDMYSQEQLRVLSVLPGLTDLASIKYIDENRLLGESDNPEETYIQEIMPAKLKLNLKYIDNRSFFGDIGLIFKTIFRIGRK